MPISKPSLLLHVCCGPCAVWPLGRLLEDWKVTGLFFNPNVHPEDEHARRLEGASVVFRAAGSPLVADVLSAAGPSAAVPPSQAGDAQLEGVPPSQAAWESFEGGKRERCAMCYNLRLAQTAKAAKAGGHAAFSTTLLVSPYQGHELIMEAGERASEREGVAFHYEDFREHFREGQAAARGMGLYMQKYCGCILSKYGR